jgi:hypothetical protein
MKPLQIFGLVGLKAFGTHLCWNPPKQIVPLKMHGSLEVLQGMTRETQQDQSSLNWCLMVVRNRNILPTVIRVILSINIHSFHKIKAGSGVYPQFSKQLKNI